MEEKIINPEHVKGLSKNLAKAGFKLNDIIDAVNSPGFLEGTIEEAELKKAIEAGWIEEKITEISPKDAKNFTSKVKRSQFLRHRKLELESTKILDSWLENSKEEEILKQTAITKLLCQSKQKQLNKFLILAGLSAASVALSIAFGILPVEPKLITLFAVFSILPSLLFWLRSQTIKYRILRGYYGNNESEARELIAFIESMVDDIPPSGGGGGMKAFPDEVIEDANPVIDGGLVGEGA